MKKLSAKDGDVVQAKKLLIRLRQRSLKRDQDASADPAVESGPSHSRATRLKSLKEYSSVAVAALTVIAAAMKMCPAGHETPSQRAAPGASPGSAQIVNTVNVTVPAQVEVRHPPPSEPTPPTPALEGDARRVGDPPAVSGGRDVARSASHSARPLGDGNTDALRARVVNQLPLLLLVEGRVADRQEGRTFWIATRDGKRLWPQIQLSGELRPGDEFRHTIAVPKSLHSGEAVLVRVGRESQHLFEELQASSEFEVGLSLRRVDDSQVVSAAAFP